jgi:hypothetical protein
LSQSIAIPSKADPRWNKLVTNGPSQPIRVLALKFMLARMAQEARRNPASLGASVDELSGFLAANPRMVADDLLVLFR